MQAMKLGTSLPTNETVFADVEQFVQQALAGGCNPAELSCALTALAVQIGLHLAPSAGRAVSSAAAAGRQRSSATRDVSALQAAFRRCHSDPEFRAVFIANCRNQ